MRCPAVVSLLVLLGPSAAAAQTLAVSGNPGLLRVSAVVAGSQPTPVSNSGTTYTVTTPSPNRTYALRARLSAPMPPGVVITGTFAAPPGAVSLGAVALDNTDRDVVTGIPRNTNATLTITYQLAPSAAGGVVPLSSRTVTLTLVRTS
ncbi:MAG: hypothetical protein ACRENU_16715 [Gemmatimonadaceae bacterium]